MAIMKDADLLKSIDIAHKFGTFNHMYSTVIAVTKENVWQIDVDANGIKKKKFGRDKVIGTGSGYRAAKMFHLTTGSDAIDSIIAASRVDKHSGGSIRFVDLNKETLVIEETEEYDASLMIDQIKTNIKKPKKLPAHRKIKEPKKE